MSHNSVYRFGRDRRPMPTESSGGNLRLTNTGGAEVDPATENTLADIEANVATEASLTNTLAREIATWTAGTLTVTDDGSLVVDDYTGSTLPTEQQTPVGVEDSTGTQVNPAENVDGASTSATTSSTGSSNAAAVTIPDGRTTLSVAYDTSGSATVTVEVSPDEGTTWFTKTTFSPDSATKNVSTLDTAFDDARIYINQNVNNLHIAAKGT